MRCEATLNCRPNGACIDIALGIADRRDSGRGVVPPHDDDVQIAGSLRGGEGYIDRRLRRLGGGVIALDIADRWRRGGQLAFTVNLLDFQCSQGPVVNP